MARLATSPAARLKKLQAALSRAAKQDCGAVLTQDPMRQMLGVSRMTLRDWCNEIEGFEESGAFRRGGNGINYEFNPVATVLFLIRHFEQQRDQSLKDNIRIREMLAGDKLDDVPAEMPMRDVREAMAINLQIMSAEKEAGTLVPADQSNSTYQELCLSMRDTLLSAPQRLDPENDWDPEFREKFDNALSDCLVLIRQDGQEALSEQDAPIPQRPDGADNQSGKRRKAG